jgi:hypothetical protein
VRPPLFTFVAVRAIAPVAGIPPTSALAMFATPCPTSSMLERWRPPIIPSATTAERSDSTPPSIAMVSAGPTSAITCVKERSGKSGCGIAALIAPKREPIVSTGSPSHCTTAVVTTRATKGDGTRWLTFGQRRMINRARSATIVASALNVPACSANAAHFSVNSGGTAPMLSPKKSLTWLDRMITAIPLVKPTITGCGMNLIAAPNLRRPIATRITPAINVATMSPSTPYCWTIP